MSKKAKTEVDEKSAVIITDAVLAENQAKLDSYEKSIKAVQERRRKVIIDSKLYTYDKLSQLYGGAEGQALLDAVTAEHTLIGKLTASGMTYEQWHSQCFALQDCSTDSPARKKVLLSSQRTFSTTSSVLWRSVLEWYF